MFERIVVGTDGSETATEAVRQAVDLARMSGAKLDIVAAFEPVSASRIREEKGEVPGDVSYAVGPREDVNVTLEAAVGMAKVGARPTSAGRAPVAAGGWRCTASSRGSTWRRR